jgi:hypothetical protein
MSRYLTAAQKAGTDALSYHWYTDCNLTKLDNIFTWKYDAPDNAWQHMYSRYWSYLGPTRIQQEVIGAAGKPMDIGVTELNIDACNFQRAPVNSNHISSLWYSDIIGRLAYNGVDFAAWYEGYGNGGQGFPAVFIEDDFYPMADTIYLRPSYYTMFMYGNYFGNTMIKTSDADPTKLSLYASLDSKDPNKLFVIVTNLNADIANAKISISGFHPDQGTKYELTNPYPLSRDNESNGINHGSTINGYKLTAKNISNAAREIPKISVNINNGIINEVFSPYSITAMVFDKDPIPIFGLPNLFNYRLSR